VSERQVCGPGGFGPYESQPAQPSASEASRTVCIRFESEGVPVEFEPLAISAVGPVPRCPRTSGILACHVPVAPRSGVLLDEGQSVRVVSVNPVQQGFEAFPDLMGLDVAVCGHSILIGGNDLGQVDSILAAQPATVLGFDLGVGIPASWSDLQNRSLWEMSRHRPLALRGPDGERVMVHTKSGGAEVVVPMAMTAPQACLVPQVVWICPEMHSSESVRPSGTAPLCRAPKGAIINRGGVETQPAS